MTKRIFTAVFLLAALAMVLHILVRPARAADLDKPLLVVATQELTGPYRGTVMHAVPRNGGHVGVILNRPLPYTMAQLFPDQAAAAAVKDPVYFGGPEQRDGIVAVHRAASGKHPGSVELMPGVWLEHVGVVIDAMIETNPNGARYYVGYVSWRPGELAEEIRRGMMVVRPADAERLFMPDTTTLYPQLAPRPRRGMVDS